MRALSGNAAEPCFWEESLHLHLSHTLHSVLQAITLRFPVVKCKCPWNGECVLWCWTELLVEIQWYCSVIGYTWLFFSAQWSNTESQKWQVSIGIDLVVLQLLFFWSDINICCVCMRLMFYNKYLLWDSNLWWTFSWQFSMPSISCAGQRFSIYCELLISTVASSSSCVTIIWGVPQDPILGPLFLIYKNDLPYGLYRTTKPVVYAYDTSVLSSGKNINELQIKLRLHWPTWVNDF